MTDKSSACGATLSEGRDLHAELSRAWEKTNLGNHQSVQIFLMCFDALWPQIVESSGRSETPRIPNDTLSELQFGLALLANEDGENLGKPEWLTSVKKWAHDMQVALEETTPSATPCIDLDALHSALAPFAMLALHSRDEWRKRDGSMRELGVPRDCDALIDGDPLSQGQLNDVERMYEAVEKLLRRADGGKQTNG